MANCGVCGKIMLMVEQVGHLQMCKTCFNRINGPAWRKKYTVYEEAEENRIKALQIAHGFRYPQHAIAAINHYFMQQMNAIPKCDSCGKHTSQYRFFGNTRLCPNCCTLLENFTRQEVGYEDPQTVAKRQESFQMIAQKNQFSPFVIKTVNDFFASKLQEGLLCTIYGGVGQILKVFEDHCVVITGGEFKIEETSKKYKKLLKADDSSSLLNKDTAKSLARSVLVGGIVKTGLNLAAAATLNAAGDTAPEKAVTKVQRGAVQVDFNVYANMDFRQKGSNELGYLRFGNGKEGQPEETDVLFFFAQDDERILKQFQRIRQKFQSNVPAEAPAPAAASAQLSAADEILKFKNLLDMGVITQEEFESKKQELLGLKS